MKRVAALLTVTAAVALASCGDARSPSEPPVCSAASSRAVAYPTISPARVPATSAHDGLFERAGREFGVPPELLRAVGYVETGWEMVRGGEELHGLAPAYGIMALRGDRLTRAAELAGVSPDAARIDAEANVRSAAALLRAYAGEGIGSGVDAWAPAVARFSGIEAREGQESYVEEVYAVLGGSRPAGTPGPASYSVDGCGTPPPAELADFAGAVWQPSPNFNQRMAGIGGEVHMIIIHSCEGSYTGCWSWLANSISGVSAHYVVREDGAEIRQLVREAARAWHIGAIYDSTLNAGHDGVLHGIQSNHFTIGIEHAGYASQSSWPPAQIEASARLVCEAIRSWNIPRDRLHIVSHAQLQPYNRTDPGAGWPWDDYLAKIDEYCGG